ncbi:MAG TPA: flagellar basal body rod protein FlgB [Beijerinckiaceae bacterium]|jgi:flagellar basal-body rod protein FlgB
MAVTDIPLVAMLKTRLHWHQTRQKLLAENVANADTPGFKPRELRAPSFSLGGTAAASGIAVARTDAAHLSLAAARPGEDAGPAGRFEVTPSGNAVSLEDEMMKVAQNQSDYQLAASLYQKSLAMLRTAVGRGR